MRDELNILWIDDSEDWMEREKETINRYLEELNIRVRWEEVTDADIIYHKIDCQSTGFANIDIFLIDYNLSLKIKENGVEKEIYGNDIIRMLRKCNIDVDIVFYSSTNESKIYSIITEDLKTYEGVYLADRSYFDTKVMKIIKKNSRKLNELSNIRGFLANQTSENDFIVNSVIYKCFNELDKENKLKVLNELNSKVNKNLDNYIKEHEKFKEKYPELIDQTNLNKDCNIRKCFKNIRLLLTQVDRYELFYEIISILEPDLSKEIDLIRYREKIVKMRNNLAHRKLVLCDEQKYIKYANDVDQLNASDCDNDCLSCKNKEFISLNQWEDLKKEIYSYSNYFDELSSKLLTKYINSNK